MAIKFIEVTGEGEYLEQIQFYILDITIEARAKTDAAAVEEANKLKEQCELSLQENGITSQEIDHIGLEIWRPWYKKKKAEKYAQHKFRLKVKDRDRLGNAVAQMAKLFDEDQYHVAMTMRQPVFEEKQNGIDAAIKSAYQDAKRKASLLAAEEGKEIGTMTKAVELSKSIRKTVSKGDVEFIGENGRSGSIGFASSPEGPDLNSVPTSERSIWLTYKFTFEIKKDESEIAEEAAKKAAASTRNSVDSKEKSSAKKRTKRTRSKKETSKEKTQTKDA